MNIFLWDTDLFIHLFDSSLLSLSMSNQFQWAQMILFEWISLNLTPLSTQSAAGTGRGRLYLSTDHLCSVVRKI